MKTKLPVISFIETSHQNKAFFNQKFTYRMIYNSEGRKPSDNKSNEKRLNDWNKEDAHVLFDGWYGKNRINWYECKNDNGDKIEFYAKTYKINSTELPYPQTIDHFITDCYRLKVSLVWRSDLVEQGMDLYHLVTGEIIL